MRFSQVLARILVVCSTLMVVFGCLLIENAPSYPQSVETLNEVKDLRVAIGNFAVDYRMFPGQPHQPQPEDQRVLSTGPFIDCLIDQNKEWNPMEVEYIHLPSARDEKGGYIPTDGSSPSRLVDRWGSPYVILLDTSGDNAIANPDLKNSAPEIVRHLGESPPPTLATDVAVFSLGKDKVEGTGDDIVSWRTWGVAAARSRRWPAWTKVLIVGVGIGVVVVLFYSWRAGFREASRPAVS